MGMNIFVSAIAMLLERQPWYLRFKGTILLTLTTLVWILAEVTPLAEQGPSWAAPTVATLFGVASILVNRLTKDGVTPSMAQRLEDAAGVLEVEQAVTLPVYGGPSSVQGDSHAD